MTLNIIGLILIFAAGMVLIFGSLLNWTILLNTKTAELFDEKFGKGKSKLAYFILGILVILLGIFAIYNGFLDDPLA